MLQCEWISSLHRIKYSILCVTWFVFFIFFLFWFGFCCPCVNANVTKWIHEQQYKADLLPVSLTAPSSAKSRESSANDIISWVKFFSSSWGTIAISPSSHPFGFVSFCCTGKIHHIGLWKLNINAQLSTKQTSKQPTWHKPCLTTCRGCTIWNVELNLLELQWQSQLSLVHFSFLVPPFWM